MTLLQIPSFEKLSIESKQERIIVTEKDEYSNQPLNSIYNSVYVKTKSKDKRQEILKRLMLFGLKPSLRMTALKMLVCKRRQVSLSDDEVEDEEGEIFIRILCACNFKLAF